MNLRETLNLPDADFTIPMKADLAIREPEMQKAWDEADLYHRILEARDGCPKFVLHDGPPYTNSPVHIGTALNKSLKDFVVRYKTMRGFYAPYVPGFDTHGLPIELAVQAKHGRLQPKEMREACRKHAEEFIAVQTQQFKRIGVLGDWENRYATLDFAFEATVVRAFARLAEKGFLYRDLRPTHWSIGMRTALADTELVYEDHVSRAIYVRFPLTADGSEVFPGIDNLYTIIWTTTPWTIPGNLGVAFHPELEYSVFRVGDDHYLIYDGLAERVFTEIGFEQYEKIATVLGSALEGLVFKHPIFDRDSLAVLADYVTTEDGTGVVHTAPGHGHEDFATGRKYGLPALCPVDEGGVYTSEALEFEGKKITDADTFIVERLRDTGNLLKDYEYRHSYPYSERDKRPVIYRTTEQWFVDVDHDDLRGNALQEISRVKWIPEHGKARITAMVENRPDWCISRQRTWGVGIPVVFGVPSGEPVFDQEIFERVAKLVEANGSAAWFEASLEDILPAGYVHPKTGETEFRRETDVLDVWLDSGVTHFAVLSQKYNAKWHELTWPADLYLEGSDQHRGWFNSSLTTAVALDGAAPYRTVLTHGFVLDEKNEKMSKSRGNVVDPIVVSNQYGADILRYWAASVDYRNDVPCGDNLFKQAGEHYRRIRNTLRFLLANLYDFEPSGQALTEDIDKWAVDRASELELECCNEYDQYDFNAALSRVHNFCARELSQFYLDAIKDRMYCEAKDSPARRSGQTACHIILLKLTKLIAPLLSHTAEEVYAKTPNADRKSSVMIEIIEPEGAALSDEFGFSDLIDFRERLFASLEPWKTSTGIKDSQDVLVKIIAGAEHLARLQSFGDELPNLLRVSWVILQEGADVAFEFEESPYLRCERSRLRRPDVEEVNGIPLTKRDRRVIGW
ncbi:MAG: isoleucine--tRNA ligase [Armatimonadota bacterium]|nr:isoleucine--tRNA ligase [Armatimonadota bacterium]